jgi:hypothetical protein
VKPPRNPRYLAWIRTQPCCVCGSKRGIEASHTGPHGLGQKSPDSSAIPLCAKHHRTGADSYHRLGPRKFAEKHNLDIPVIVRRLNLKPTIRVESGCYVTYLDGQRYVLGKTDAGIQSAIREALQLCREISWSRRLPPDNLYDRYSAPQRCDIGMEGFVCSTS